MHHSTVVITYEEFFAKRKEFISQIGLKSGMSDKMPPRLKILMKVTVTTFATLRYV